MHQDSFPQPESLYLNCDYLSQQYHWEYQDNPYIIPNNQMDDPNRYMINQDQKENCIFEDEYPIQTSIFNHDQQSEYISRFKQVCPKDRKKMYTEVVQVHINKYRETQISEKKINKPKKKMKQEPEIKKKSYDCAKDGRKNITKNFGLQLRRYFMQLSAYRQVGENQAIQKFINTSRNGQFCYSSAMFKELTKDKIAKNIANRYFEGALPISNVIASNKIKDLRWNIRQIQVFRSLIA